MPKPHIKHTIFLRVPCQVKQIFAIKAGDLLDSVKTGCTLQALPKIPIQGGILQFFYFTIKDFLLLTTSKITAASRTKPTLAFTHFQPAQPTTVGKRATLWTQEFLLDLEDLEYVLGTMKLLGSKGTTGTQASFLELFDGDQETIDKIDPMIAEKMGFKECYPVSGQTYSRKVDTRVANILAGIAASAHKMSNDIRLLQHLKEVEEPLRNLRSAPPQWRIREIL